MADITYTNTTDPDMKIDINFSSSRNKDKVTVTAKIVEKFVNEYGYGCVIDWLAIKKEYQGYKLSKPLIYKC